MIVIDVFILNAMAGRGPAPSLGSDNGQFSMPTKPIEVENVLAHASGALSYQSHLDVPKRRVLPSSWFGLGVFSAITLN
jgi:hypothetical protein